MNPIGSNVNNGYLTDFDDISVFTENSDDTASDQGPIPVKTGSDERRELRANILKHKLLIGMEYAKAQESWLQTIAAASDVGAQDRNREEPIAPSELTNVELKALGRSLSGWAALGLIHHFSILGGSPDRNLDFGQVSGLIGSTRNSENPEKEALDLYIAHCAEKLDWGYFQTAFQTMWIKTSYWALSGVIPIVVEKTFCNVLDKIRLKSKEAGNFEYVCWKLVEHLEAFLKRYGDASADGPNVNAEELKVLCEGLSPFLMSEFFPELTLCEDRFKKIPFLGFFSFLCRPLDSILNTFIHYFLKRSLPSLLKKGLEALERLIGGKEGRIHYRMANPILAFINEKLKDLPERIKNPSPEPDAPLPYDVQKKLQPLTDEIMKLSGVPCLDVEIKEYIRSVLCLLPPCLVREDLEEVLSGDYRGKDLREQVVSLAGHVAKEWDSERGRHLSELAKAPLVKERIRDEIRSGVIKGIYSLMQYLQKEQVQEVIFQKTLNLAANSLFPESQTPPPAEEELHEKFMSLRAEQTKLFQDISSSLVDSVVDVMASKWIYINSDKQVNHHWSTQHAKITGYLNAGIISLQNAIDVAKEESNDLESIQFLEVLSKHLVLWEGLCDVLQRATNGAPRKSKDNITESFTWLYKEAEIQINAIADLKREWDSCVVRRDLKVLYGKMHEELDKKMAAYNQAKEKDSAKGLNRLALQMLERIRRAPTSEEESVHIASPADKIKDLINKEIELKDETENLLKEVEQSELDNQKKVLDLCVTIVEISKDMSREVETVNNYFNQLKEKIQLESHKYGNRRQESRKSLISKADKLQAGHKKCLEKIQKIRCDKIPQSTREALGIGNIVASLIKYVDPVSVNAIGPAKQILSEDLKSIVDKLIPLVLGDPSEPSLGEAGAAAVIHPLSRKNLYTDVERLTLSGLLSYYQSHAR